MALGDSYDSPTFLSQKDKYLFGLTLIQLMMLMGVGGFEFLLTFMLPLGSMVTRLLVLAPVVGLSALLMFVRISGVSLPAFLFLAATIKLRNSSYEGAREALLRGSKLWLAQREERARSGGGRMGRLGRKRQEFEKKVDIDQRKAELKAEADKAVVEGSMAAEQWARDGIKTLLKGR